MKIVKLGGDLLKKTTRAILNVEESHGIQWNRYVEFNNLLKGFRQGEMTVFSGRTGVGKTTFLSEYSLDLCEQGVNTLWGSFEIPLHRLCKVMVHQFSGKTLSNVSVEEVEMWMKAFYVMPMYFLDAHGSQSQIEMLKCLQFAVSEFQIQHVVIDNLQFALGSADDRCFSDRFTRQDVLVQALRQFSTQFNCHVTVVVHPRKEDHTKLLNINSIYGGGKITQESDNVILYQYDAGSLYPRRYVEVVKNRYDGTLGRIDLKFNKLNFSYKPVIRSINNVNHLFSNLHTVM